MVKLFQWYSLYKLTKYYYIWKEIVTASPGFSSQKTGLGLPPIVIVVIVTVTVTTVSEVFCSLCRETMSLLNCLL